jgi:hypothetical protein
MDEAKTKAFLLELRALTVKHGVEIGGCGCCGSPWLAEADVSDERAGYCYGKRGLRWVTPTDEWLWSNFGESVVR